MLHAITPSIWTPRSGPWWRLPRWRDMSTLMTLKYGAAGHLLYGPNGHLIHTCEEETDPPPACKDCPTGEIPESLTLTLNIPAYTCECCIAAGAASAHWESFSGCTDTVTLERNEAITSACRFETTTPVSATFKYYRFGDNGACNDTFAIITNSAHILIDRSPLGHTGEWLIQCVPTDNSSASAVWLSLYTAVVDCDQQVIADRYVACTDDADCGPDRIGEGTVTLTPNMP